MNRTQKGWIEKNKAVKIIFAAPMNAVEGPKLTYFFVSNMSPSNV